MDITVFTLVEVKETHQNIVKRYFNDVYIIIRDILLLVMINEFTLFQSKME